jgi:hypothetical protein
MNDLGLVSVLPPLIYVSLFILMVSFCLALHQSKAPEPVLLLHVIALIIVLHATPIIVYGTLRYSWAWKHMGIVDYIQRYHSVDPSIGVLNVYHNWPGFFAQSTFLTEVAGLENPLFFAKWAPVFFNVLYLGALLLIFKTFTSDRRLIWLSVWFFFLANWIGQDYFSPQALSYFLYLLIIGICLRWFGNQTPPSEPDARQNTVWGQVSSWFQRFVDKNLVECGFRIEVRFRLKHYLQSDIPAGRVPSLQRVGLMLVIILLFVVVASSHQLTPFMTIAAIAGLVVCRLCSTKSLPVLMVVIAVSWLIFGAREFFISELDNIVASFGRVSDNLNDNLIDLSLAPWGQRVVALVGRGLCVFVSVMALLGVVRRLRRGYLDLPGILLTLVAFTPLLGTAYGGEILFRVYFFALPTMIFFGAALTYPSPASGTSVRTAILTILLSITLFFGFSFAHYGKDQQYHFTEHEVDAARHLYSSAPPGALLIEGSRSYPTQFRNYEFFTYVPISRAPRESQLKILHNPVEVLSRWMSNKKYAKTYLIITRSQKADVDALGLMPAGFLESIERALLESREFQVTYDSRDAKIFVLADDVNGDEL